MEITDLKNKVYSTVGKPIPNIDGILRSPYAHARILNIDTSKARKVKGVEAIITGVDTPKRKYGGLTMFPETVDEYGLALEKVRYIGDEIAAVAAIDEETAQQAISLI
ncbi:MAG: 4-hydroxybenzoyl-CoA reductase, partial [Deltaproteobacteria bacterium]|nr:4-hydroxybenzoyl-CoA reductase [Deltaproteobacteria bacterium]